MRVASNTFTAGLLQRLNNLSLRQQQLNTAAATGQRITLPEDDPAATRRVIDLQAQSSAVAQYRSNIARQRELGTATYDVINSLKKISDRVGELATLADGLKSPQELAAYGTEVNDLLNHAVQLMNTKYDGQYLFGGTRSDQPPFTTAVDGSRQITAVTFGGNTNSADAEIAAGETISTQVPGVNTSGSGPRGLVADSRSGANFFAHLIALRDHLLAGDSASVQSVDHPALARDEENIIFHVSYNGAVQSRLEAADAVAANRAAALVKQTSGEADADLAETITRFHETQTAYQAALQTGASVMDLSLLNFLR